MKYTNDLLIKIGVANGQFPNFIFRYRPINDFFDDIFINNSLWFSNPQDFNDPFDCRVLIDTKNTVEEIKYYLELQGITSNKALELAKHYIKKPILFDKIINKAVKDIVTDSGICCFSQTCDNILMWSHYTDSHKGVCLKYDITKDTDFFMTPIYVKYKKKYEPLNYIREQNMILDKLIRAKSIDWEYEKEIRILKSHSSGLIRYKKEALIEVIFGCKTDVNEVIRIKQLLKCNGFSHVTFSQAEMKDDEYGLKFKSI